MKCRAFHGRAAAPGAGAALDRRRSAPGGGGCSAAQAADPPRRAAPPMPFHGAHQAGDPHPRAAARDLRRLRRRSRRRRPSWPTALQTLSERARFLTARHDALLGAPGEGPPSDNGILGPRVPADGLTVTVGVGASLFDDRYGLAAPSRAR